MKTAKLIDETMMCLQRCIGDRSDVFFSTSYGKQSALLHYFISQVSPSTMGFSVTSPLTMGNIEKHREYLDREFSLPMTVVDRTGWLESVLKGMSFLDLSDSDKILICRQIKRSPLCEYIEKNDHKIWVTAIRKEQTERRKGSNFLNTTDLGVVKVAPLLIGPMKTYRE